MTRSNRLLPLLAAIAVVMLCCVAVAAWLGLIPMPGDGSVSAFPEKAGQAGDAAPCGRCGLIEAVREVHIGRAVSDRTVAGAALAQQLGGFSSVTNILGLAVVALAGKLEDADAGTATFFETTVRFADGSLRILTEMNPPSRKPGDMVKVIGGRIFAIPEEAAALVAAATQ